jgi:hypothetical protein
MLNLALLLFAVAAVGGLILATLHFRGKDRPWPLAILHGLLAASGLVVLFLAVRNGGPGHSQLALGLFVVAALGGFLLFAYHLQKKRLPSLVVVIHAGVAVAAFAILGAAVLLGS